MLMDLPELTKPLFQKLSRVSKLASDQNWSVDELQGFHRAQELALQSAREIGAMIQPGWTEKKAAGLMESYLRDFGVTSFFHRPFVWYGARTRFAGFKNYGDFMPTENQVHEGDAVILDVAPIVDGFACDIGYTTCLGENVEVQNAKDFLQSLRAEIPSMVRTGSGSRVWEEVDRRIAEAGYENCHKIYPLGVLGHRLYRVSSKLPTLQWMRFGWQSYAELLRHGVLSEVLAQFSEADLNGLWAIEPHLGRGNVGAKFEEILWVRPEGAVWLSDWAKGHPS